MHDLLLLVLRESREDRQLFGIVAMIIGVPIYLIIQAIKNKADSKPSNSLPSITPDYISNPLRQTTTNELARPELTLTEEQFERIMQQFCDKLQEAHWFYARVAGVTRKNNNGTSRQDLLVKMRTMDQPFVVPEPNNIADSYAQAIYDRPTRQQLGYLEKRVAREVYQHRKTGGECWAFVRSVNYADGTNKLGMRIGLILFTPRPEGEGNIQVSLELGDETEDEA